MSEAKRKCGAQHKRNFNCCKLCTLTEERKKNYKIAFGVPNYKKYKRIIFALKSTLRKALFYGKNNSKPVSKMNYFLGFCFERKNVTFLAFESKNSFPDLKWLPVFNDYGQNFQI